MKYISLSKIENQSFFIVVNGIRVDFRLHYFREVLYCDISIENKLIAGAVRCVADGWLIPKQYETSIGNFRFETSEEKYPNAKNFDASCFFVHYDHKEIEEYNGKLL